MYISWKSSLSPITICRNIVVLNLLKISIQKIILRTYEISFLFLIAIYAMSKINKVLWWNGSLRDMIAIKICVNVIQNGFIYIG